MNPNILLGGLLVGGVVAAGAAMLYNGDFTATEDSGDAERVADGGSSLKIDTSSGVGKWLRAISLATGPSQIGGDRRLARDPDQTVRTEAYGYDILHPGMVSDAGAMHLAQQVLAGIPVVDPFSVPSTVEFVPRSSECGAPEPPEQSRFVNIHIGRSDLESEMFIYSNRRLASIMDDWIDQKKLRNHRVGNAPKGGDRAGLVNVALTDTSQPLYLVLQNAGPPVLWNIQSAPGVEISDIVLVGQAGQGVVMAGDAGPSITSLEIGETCAPEPARMPAPHWGLVSRNDLSAATENEFIAKAEIRAKRYTEWFTAVFGRPSEQNAIGAQNVSNILVGPPPATAEERLQYTQISESTAYLTQADNVFANDPSGVSQQAKRQLELVVAAAGGDINNLTPDPMERAE